MSLFLKTRNIASVETLPDLNDDYVQLILLLHISLYIKPLKSKINKFLIEFFDFCRKKLQGFTDIKLYKFQVCLFSITSPFS